MGYQLSVGIPLAELNDKNYNFENSTHHIPRKDRISRKDRVLKNLHNITAENNNCLTGKDGYTSECASREGEYCRCPGGIVMIIVTRLHVRLNEETYSRSPFTCKQPAKGDEGMICSASEVPKYSISPGHNPHCFCFESV